MGQILDIPIDGGLDENADERLRDRLAVAEDVLYTRRGGLQPRLGQELLAPTVVDNWVPAGGDDKALAAHRSQVAAVTGGVVRPFADNDGALDFLGSTGVASAYTVSRQNVDGTSGMQRDYTFADGAGFRLLAWQETGFIRFRVVDATTGAVIWPTRDLPTGGSITGPRVHYTNGLFFIAYESALAGGINVDTFNPAFGFYQANGVPLLTPFARSGWTSTVHPDGVHLVLATTTAATTMSVVTLTAVQTPAVVGTLIFTVASIALCLSLHALTASRLWLVYGLGGAAVGPTPVVSIYAARFNATVPTALTTALTPTLIVNDTLDHPGTNYSMFPYMVSAYDRGDSHGAFLAFTFTGVRTVPDGAFFPYTGLYTIDDTGNPTQQLLAAGSALQSDIWVNDAGTAFCTVAQTRPLMAQAGLGIVPGLGCMQILAFLRSLESVGAVFDYPCQVHSTFGVLVTPAFDTYNADLYASAQTRHTGFISPAVVQADGSVVTTAYALERADTSAHAYLAIAAPVLGRQHAQMGGRTLITGGTPSHWDGRSVVEWGFVHSPNYYGSAIANQANSIGAGTYSWAAAYEWIDANGAIMRSAPTYIATAQTLTANQKITFSITGSQLSHKRDFIGGMGFEGGAAYIGLYRTESNSTGPYYRLTAIEVPTANFNRYGSARVVIEDAYPDTGGALGPLATFPPLYTTGDVLDANPVPGCTMVTTWQQRFVLAGTDDDSVWFSTENEDGEVPYFSIGLRLAPFENGRITGIAVLDDKLLLFKQTSVYTLAGQLPNKQGAGSIPSPVQVSSDAGCIDPQSVVVFPQGVMFRSARGLYLCDRSLNISFVGEPVARTIEASAKTVAPVLVTKQNHIRFDVNESDDGGPGSVVVFDYLRGMWTQFRYFRSGEDSLAPSAQLAMSDGKVYWLDGNAALYRERAAAYSDAGPGFFTYRVRSGWIKAAGAQGYFTASRAGILGKYGAPHVLTVNVYADYDETTLAAVDTWDLASAPTAGYQFVASVATARTARMQAICIEAIVSARANVATSNPIPAELSSFVLEWDPIDNAPQRRIPAAQKR